MCFIVTSPVLSHPPVDSGCKNKNQAKREKRRPPGTVEFIVSEAAPRRLMAAASGWSEWFLSPLAGGSERFPQQHRAQVQHHSEQTGSAEQALFSQRLSRSGAKLGAGAMTTTAAVASPDWLLIDCGHLYRSCLFLTVTRRSRTRTPPSPMAWQTRRHVYVLGCCR